MTYLNEIRWVFAVVIGLVASGWDIKCRRIPNWLTFPGMAGGIVIALVFNFKAWPFPFLGLVTGLLLLIIPYSGGGIGTGDLKLVMALGAILGAKGVFWTTIYGAVAGGFLSLGFMIHRDGFSKAMWRFLSLVQALWNAKCRQGLKQQADGERQYIPYGVAITAGLICFLWMGPGLR